MDLAADPSTEVQAAVAFNRACPPGVLLSLCARDNLAVLKAVASNPSSPARALQKINRVGAHLQDIVTSRPDSPIAGSAGTPPRQTEAGADGPDAVPPPSRTPGPKRSMRPAILVKLAPGDKNHRQVADELGLSRSWVSKVAKTGLTPAGHR